jgi:hypothetical protein
MNPETQIILDEIARRFADHDAKWDRRVSEQESRWEATFAEFTRGQVDRVVALETASNVFEDWRQGLEGVVDDLKLEVGKVSRYWERAVVDKPTSVAGILAPSPSAAIFAPSPTAAGRPSAGSPATSPHGHRVNNHNREGEFGSVTTLLHPPVKGMCLPLPPVPQFTGMESKSMECVGNRWEQSHPGVGGGAVRGRLPQLNFPSFDGENPKLWIRRAQDYFDMYSVEPQMWVKVASMHLSGAAGRWFSSLGDHCPNVSWTDFCRGMLERFGKDEHEYFIRKLFRIRQTATVSEYVEHFMALVDNLNAYGRQLDPMYFVQRFVDGLREDIRASVFIHRPSSLDTACVLALLQEEVAGASKRPDLRRADFAMTSKPFGKGPMPLPLPPRPGHPGMVAEEDKRVEAP